MNTDLSEIKSGLNLTTLAEQYTGQQVVKNKIRCFIHADNTPSMHIYDDGHFKCFGCGIHGDQLDFLGYVHYGAAYDPHVHLADVINRVGDIDVYQMPAQARPAQKTRLALDPALVDKFCERFGPDELSYWRTQGITPKAVYSLQIGYTGERWAFPWFYRGVLTAMKLRRNDQVIPDAEKYTSVPGSRFAAPFNIDTVLEAMPAVVLIAEDEKSVMAAASHNLTAISCPANAFKAEWALMLSPIERVIVVADNDTVGIESAEKIRRMLPGATIAVPPIGKDLFDYALHLREACGELEVAGVALRDWLSI